MSLNKKWNQISEHLFIYTTTHPSLWTDCISGSIQMGWLLLYHQSPVWRWLKRKVNDRLILCPAQQRTTLLQGLPSPIKSCSDWTTACKTTVSWSDTSRCWTFASMFFGSPTFVSQYMYIKCTGISPPIATDLVSADLVLYTFDTYYLHFSLVPVEAPAFLTLQRNIFKTWNQSAPLHKQEPLTQCSLEKVSSYKAVIVLTMVA